MQFSLSIINFRDLQWKDAAAIILSNRWKKNSNLTSPVLPQVAYRLPLDAICASVSYCTEQVLILRFMNHLRWFRINDITLNIREILSTNIYFADNSCLREQDVNQRIHRYMAKEGRQSINLLALSCLP